MCICACVRLCVCGCVRVCACVHVYVCAWESDLAHALLTFTSAECNSGSFGLKCSSTCTCQNGAACDPVSGACTCQPGWREANCSKREY